MVRGSRRRSCCSWGPSCWRCSQRTCSAGGTPCETETAQFASDPPSAAWHASTRRCRAIRRERCSGSTASCASGPRQQQFAAVQAAGRGYDNGLSESRDRGELEAELAELARSRDHAARLGGRQPARHPRLRRLAAVRADRPGARRPERGRLPGRGPARPRQRRTPSSTSSCCCVSWSRRAPDSGSDNSVGGPATGTAARAAEFPGGAIDCSPRSSSSRRWRRSRRSLGLVPLAALALAAPPGGTRAARARAAGAVQRRPAGRRVAIAAVALLLGLAAAQPVLRSTTSVEVRTDAEATS